MHRRRLGDRERIELWNRSRALLAALDPRAREHRTDARATVFERDGPEPTRFVAGAEDDDLNVAFAIARIAPRVLPHRENSRFVELGHFFGGAFFVRGDRVATRRVDRELAFERVARVLFVRRDDAHGATLFRIAAIDSVDLPAFAHVGAARFRVAKKDVVELVARHLERERRRAIERFGEIVAGLLQRAALVKIRAAFHDEASVDVVEDSDVFEHRHRLRKQRLAEMKPRMMGLLEHERRYTALCELRCADRSAGTPARDHDIERHIASRRASAAARAGCVRRCRRR